MKKYLILFLSFNFLIAGQDSYTEKFVIPMLRGQTDWLVQNRRVPGKLVSLCHLAFGIADSDPSHKQDALDDLMSHPRMTEAKLRQIIKVKLGQVEIELRTRPLRLEKAKDLCYWALNQLKST